MRRSSSGSGMASAAVPAAGMAASLSSKSADCTMLDGDGVS